MMVDLHFHRGYSLRPQKSNLLITLGIISLALLVFTPFLLKNFDVLVWFALVWAEHQEIGFAGTLGISDNDIGRNDGFHDDFLSLP